MQLPSRPARFQTKSDAAYAEIREQILTGVLMPNSTIDQEHLAFEIGYSTTPLREALRRLEAEGWVLCSAHREMRVSPTSRREIEELYLLLSELDVLAAGIACKRLTDDAIHGIREQADGLARAHPRDGVNSNRLVHRAVYAGSGNQVLTTALDQLWDRCDRYWHLLLRHDPDAIRDVSRSHVRVVAALGARDDRLLRERLGAHLQMSLERCCTLFV